jgi:concentrative nucleoside transporter, CNT family
MQVLWGGGGMLLILGLAFLFSTNRRAINPRTVIGALVITVAFAIMVLYWDFGRFLLNQLTKGIQAIIDASNAGIQFLFGGVLDLEGVGFVFAFQVLPVIIFFSSLMSVLYYLGIMQWIIRLLGGAIARLLRTSHAESLSATANIFVGQTEGFLVVRPFVQRMTRSELFCVMTVGLATVAGSVLIGYSLVGVPLNYLLAASFMTFPAGILMAKIMVPETEPFDETNEEADIADTESVNVIDAAARGAAAGLNLALIVGALLIAFISLIALLNTILGFFGGLIGFPDLTFELLLGYVFAPIAFVIGVPWPESVDAGNLIGQKTILNEFVAFTNFGAWIGEFSDKAVAVITFALCGFANFGSLAILLGGLAEIAPGRRADIAKLGLRSILAGTLANLLNAAIAGMLIG